MSTKYTEWRWNTPNDRKTDKMAVKIYQHFPLQDPPKFTQIEIFGLKICHLATLQRKAITGSIFH
jgi:hypothetical protein